MSNQITTFESNKTYLMSWIGDSELKTPFTVIKRTAKTITVQDVRTKETKTTLNNFRNSFKILVFKITY